MKRIGILGGGQLGRMMALSARQMGYSLITLDPTENAPCAQVSDQQIQAPFTDVEAAKRLAAESDVVTYEFENISHEVAEAIGSKLIHGTELLFRTQHRIREKELIEQLGYQVAPYQAVETTEDLLEAKRQLGLPFVLKTARFGYDGKGQTVIRTELDLQTAIKTFESTEYVAEKWLPFDQEISVIVARSGQETKVFPVSENIHQDNILHLSIVPARIPNELKQQAIELATRLADDVNLIGTLAIELFVVGGELIVNELAPRPHNSGHYSIDACETSQFEQHIRAICGLPLGDTRLTTPVVMANILGQHITALYEELPTLSSRTKVHLYGKQEAKQGRKMGHLNILADSVEEALAEVERLQIWKETVR